MTTKIGVLVVDDSAYMRKVISDMIQTDDALFVIDTARNGLDAIEKIKKYKPDVVTLDVEMPELDGLSALVRIMKECPTPVIMLSSLTSEGSETTIKALTIGAVDFVAKPSGTISLDIDKVKDELVSKIKASSRAVIKNMTAAVSRLSCARMIESVPTVKSAGKIPTKLVIIGSSTGGPNALQQVIPRLPGNIPAAVLVVQHMPPGFTSSLANRLNDCSSVEVTEAKEGDLLQVGKVYVAPGGFHLIMRSRTILGLNQEAP
ncbi:MAG TPA: chemotaxis-specific protein-glutamate methyltransferase CheB, partial [Desulfobacteria bacterium]|nr:chemotaxis-specific protein-glutamate methyltransferase CheB [Desulfobacteria bacterium]